MNVLSLVPARTVLLISDEMLFIYASDATGARLVASVPWDAENFEKDVAAIIAKDCNRKPVILLNDMVEQHYRKERVLRKGVGILDRASMLERKLAHAFPNYPIRASFPLKEKLKKSELSGMPADVYIFAAIPNSLQFLKTLEAVKLSLASIAAVCLLPVEAADMVKKLAEKIDSKKKQKAKWIILLGQHQSGGLRQVVIKNGEIALTRITPMVTPDDSASSWAHEAFQAFTSTMSYVSRFGYQAEDGLKVLAITNPENGGALEKLIEEAHDYTALTPSEAAKLLGFNIGKPDPEGYADRLHALWTGRKNRFILPMQASEITQVSKPRKYALVAMLILGLGLGFLGYQTVTQLFTMSTIGGNIEDAESKHQQLKVQYEKEVQRKEALGFDVKLVQSSIGVYDLLEARNIKVLPLFLQIGKSLNRDMRFDQVTVSQIEGQPDPLAKVVSEVDQAFSEEPAKKPIRFEVRLQTTFPSTTDIDKGNKEIADLRDRLQANMPEYDVSVTKFLKDYAYVDEITVETGKTDKAPMVQDFIVELVIKGR